MGIGNAKGHTSDIREKTPPSINSGHKGGRRKKTGMKEPQLASARTSSLSQKHVFRSGAQDGRIPNSAGGRGGLGSDATEGGNGPTGAVVPSALALKTRRRVGSPHMKPSAHS
jgi:hypothetical protein